VTQKTALVTGGNSGIGFECARALARDRWHVVIASRDAAASARAAGRIAAESGPGVVSSLDLDLGSLASVRAFAKELAARDVPLDALVLNAGVQFQTGPKRSVDGYEATFAVNHLGHFLLTNLLLSRLLVRAPARIVVVASGVHDPKQRTGMPHPAIGDLDTLAATGGPSPDRFEGRLAYVNSKLCNLWFSYELVRRLEAAGLGSVDGRRLTVNAFDPGLVPGSGLARDYTPALRWIWDHVLPALAAGVTRWRPGISTAPKSGAALARLVTDPALGDVTARYFPSTARWSAAPSSDESYDVAKARRLWDASVRMTRLAADESPLGS
jgi:light-dependent protochlorophyllide reductase